MPTAKQLKDKVKEQAADADWGSEADEEGFPEEVPDFGEWFDFEKNPVAIGTYVGSHDGTFGAIHDFASADGEPFSIPGHTMLTRKLKGLEGKIVRVELRGELEQTVKGRKPAKDYGVRYRNA